VEVGEDLGELVWVGCTLFRCVWIWIYDRASLNLHYFQNVNVCIVKVLFANYNLSFVKSCQTSIIN
jgi:hypothetical protein